MKSDDIAIKIQSATDNSGLMRAELLWTDANYKTLDAKALVRAFQVAVSLSLQRKQHPPTDEPPSNHIYQYSTSFTFSSEIIAKGFYTFFVTNTQRVGIYDIEDKDVVYNGGCIVWFNAVSHREQQKFESVAIAYNYAGIYLYNYAGIYRSKY